jgi:uncharacterized damage-inducible protein DinB
MAEPEVWLRGPIAGYPPLLLPVVHSLLQVREDMSQLAATLPDSDLWQRPGGAASIGFHIRHTAGALDRLLTYARGEALSEDQLRFLKAEGVAGEPAATVAALVSDLDRTIDAALEHVRVTDATTLLHERRVGRAGLPATVGGLLFHAAEHSTRHAGQAITTARILTAQRSSQQSG